MRIVGRPPGLRECEVEVPAGHGSVEVGPRQGAEVDRHSHLGEVRADVVLEGQDGGVTLVNDEVDCKRGAARGGDGLP